MDVAILYQPVYLIVVTILTFVALGQYSQAKLNNLNRSSTSLQSFALVVTFLLTLIIGFRPQSVVFVDMVNYMKSYYHEADELFVFSLDTENFIFDNLFSFLASHSVDITVFFLLMAAVYFFGIYMACKKLFPNDTFLAFVVYLGAFSTFGYGTNGIKAGAAASIFLVALAFHEKKLLSVFLAVVSYGAHHAMQVVVVAYIVVLLVKNRKYYLYGWLLCLAMAALHITFFQDFLGGLTDEQGAGYLLVDRPDEISGFRIDFILYSAVPIFLGHRIINKYHIQSREYDLILNLYTLVNAVWLLCLYANDINRIAYLSWHLLPFLLLYPFLKIIWSQKQFNYLKYAVYGHLGFTLFMDFVYYTLIHA